jgi:hypothetical protein
MPMFFIKPLCAFLTLFLLVEPAVGGTILVEDQRLDNRNIVLILGPIERGDELKFSEATNSISDAIIVFDSSRSPISKQDVWASIQLGFLIKSKGYDTAILHPGTCESTCSLMWMAGKNRWVGEEAFVVVGNYLQSQTAPNDAPDMYALIGYYMGKLDFSPEVIALATSWKGSNRFVALGASELSQLGIAAKVLDSRWIESATYPNGPLPPPPLNIAPARK